MDETRADSPGRRSWREPAFCVVVVAVAQLYVFPYFVEIHSANELSRLFLTRAAVDHHQLSVDSQFRLFGAVGDRCFRKGHFYSDKAPGAAMVIAPAYYCLRAASGWKHAKDVSLRDSLRVARIFGSGLPTLILLVLLWFWLAEHVRRRALRVALLLVYGLGSTGYTYSLVFMGHQLVAALLFATVFFIDRVGPTDSSIKGWRTWAWAAAAGGVLTLSVCTEYQSLFFIAPLGLMLLWRTRRRRRLWFAIVLAGSVPLALTMAYHTLAFGSPFRTGYSFLDQPSWQWVQSQGFFGIVWPRWSAFVGSFFGPQKGTYALAPIWLLAWAGFQPWLAKVGARRFPVVASLVIAAGYTLLVSSLVYWVGGWGLGQRHFAPAMPFLVLPLGILLERLLDTGRRLRAAAVLGLGSASVLITGMASAFFPLTPDAVQNPFFGIMLPLWGKGYGPYSWGTDLGLSPAAGFVPLMVLFMAVALFIPLAIGGSLRQRLKGLLVAGLVTASVFAAWSLVPVHTWTESQGVVAELERIYEPKPRLVVPTTFVPGRLP